MTHPGMWVALNMSSGDVMVLKINYVGFLGFHRSREWLQRSNGKGVWVLLGTARGTTECSERARWTELSESPHLVLCENGQEKPI